MQKPNLIIEKLLIKAIHNLIDTMEEQLQTILQIDAESNKEMATLIEETAGNIRASIRREKSGIQAIKMRHISSTEKIG